MSPRPRRDRDRLLKSQMMLNAAIETNQGALVDQVEHLVRPVDDDVRELQARFAAQQEQIDQLVNRIELLEQSLKLERSA